jgi:hypothetical protein
VLKRLNSEPRIVIGEDFACFHALSDTPDPCSSLLTCRLAELDARDGEMASKLAAIGQTMPVIAGA